MLQHAHTVLITFHTLSDNAQKIIVNFLLENYLLTTSFGKGTIFDTGVLFKEIKVGVTEEIERCINETSEGGGIKNSWVKPQ